MPMRQRMAASGMAMLVLLAAFMAAALVLPAAAHATPVENVTLLVDGGHQGQAGHTPAPWGFGFDTSGSGGPTGGDSVTATFPGTGFDLTGATAVLGSEFGVSCTTAPANVVGQTVTVTLGASCSLADATTGSMTVSHVNPTAGSY